MLGSNFFQHKLFKCARISTLFFNFDVQFHFWMNAAEHSEIARGCESDVGLASRFLITGIEIERVGFDISMVQKISVIIHDSDNVAAYDTDHRRLKHAILLGNRDFGRVLRCPGHFREPEYDRSDKRQFHACISKNVSHPLQDPQFCLFAAAV